MKYSKDEIYKYIDNNGIPFTILVKIGLKIRKNEHDILQKIQLENDPSIENIVEKGSSIISKHVHNDIIEPLLPKKFKLSKKEQIDIILKWFKDTTGYFIEEFKTLFELPVLNNNPFLLVIEKGYNDRRLALASETINGDLYIYEKYNSHGKLQSNWLRTLGRIKKINGNLHVYNEMDNFGSLEIINGNLNFSNHIYQYKLESLKPIKKINGDLYLKNTHTSLGTIEEIKGNLNLRKTTVKDLGSLKKVGGNILISRSEKENFNFTNIEIGGKVKFFNDIFNKNGLTLPKE